MIRLAAAIIFTLASLQLVAQQQTMFTMYMFNTQIFNPAYVGTHDKLSVMAFAREQWVGMQGAPSTQNVSIHLPISKQRIGLGFNLINDQVGPVQEIMASADFSYIVRLGAKTSLSFGLKGEIDVHQLRLSDLTKHQQNDPSANTDRRGRFLPNFGAGVYLYHPSYFVGLSVPRLLRNTISVETDAVNTSSLGRQDIHSFLTAGYIMELSSGVVFRPSVLAKYVQGAPISVDLAANFLINERLWLGASYRIRDALSALVQVNITENLMLGYSYGYSLSEIMRFNSGTHEIMLIYELGSDKRRFRSPRYF